MNYRLDSLQSSEREKERERERVQDKEKGRENKERESEIAIFVPILQFFCIFLRGNHCFN